MIVSPFNNVLVKIDTKYIQDITNVIRMANLNPNTQVNPADYVSITGEVVSTPRAISKRYDYKGFSIKDIKVSDIAIFSYAVIFTFTETEDGSATYRNMFRYKEREYWKVDIQNLYAVIRKGMIIMQNGYCMVQNIAPPSLIVMPNNAKKSISTSTATLTNIGNNIEGGNKIEAVSGDIVHYNPQKLVQYSIKDKKFGILRQKDIFGIEIGRYNFLNN